MLTLQSASSSASTPVAQIYAALGWLAGVAIVVAIIGLLIHRRFSTPRDSPGETPFSLAQLRRMKDEGQITEAEHDRVRARMIGQGMAVLETDNETASDPADCDVKPDVRPASGPSPADRRGHRSD